MHPLYTIGYEGGSLERLLATLNTHGVAHVLDIRRTPLSRKPGFAKKALAAHLASAGIAYTHIVELGTPTELRAFLKMEHDYPQFFAAYRAHLTGQEAALARACELAQASPSALLCFERDPQTCHRLIVAEAMLNMQPDFDLTHLELPPAPSGH